MDEQKVIDDDEVHKFNDNRNDSGKGNDNGNGDGNGTETHIKPHLNPNLAPKIRQTSDIFKLNIDCFVEIFDFLSLLDLIAVGKTCKRLKQVAAFCFHQTYSAAKIECSDKKVCVNRKFEVTDFAEVITSITLIYPENLANFLDIHLNFKRLREIEFCYIELSKSKMGQMSEILNKVTGLALKSCTIESKLHDSVLTFFPNLNRLSVKNCKIDHEWLARQYPMLEFFEWIANDAYGIVPFLEINANICHFTTDAKCLWANGRSMMNSGLRLNALAIEFAECDDIDFEQFFDLLNELHANRIFDRLELHSVWGFQQRRADQLRLLDECIGKLHIDYANESIELFAFEHLQDFYVESSQKISDLESLAKNLLQLKRIHFGVANFNDILLFISHAAKLNKVKVNRLCDGHHFSTKNKIINLSAVNAEREKLTKAKMVALFVDEDIYLATKWTLNVTELVLVRLRRLHSSGWNWFCEAKKDFFKFFVLF